jgi:uncharacterized protein
MGLQKQHIEAIKHYFSGQPVLKAYLFGSYNRGEENSESDIDLLVELDYSVPVGLEFVQMQLDLEGLLQKRVDLVSARGLSKYLKPVIDKEKTLPGHNNNDILPYPLQPPLTQTIYR